VRYPLNGFHVAFLDCSAQCGQMVGDFFDENAGDVKEQGFIAT